MTVMVITPKKAVSIMRLASFVMYFLRKKERYVLTVMKRDPNVPPSTPRTKAPPICLSGTEIYWSSPNFSVPAELTVSSPKFIWLCFSWDKTESVKVEQQQQKKILHSMLNVQNVVGFESS